MRTRAVLFDFDGVLADTENVHVAAWERTFAAMGWDVAPDVCARAAEIDDRDFLSQVFAQAGTTGDVDGWVRRKQRLTVALLADSPRLLPGAAALVERLRGRARLAVVSGTWRENVAVVLNATGLAGAFEFVIGKEDVEAGKPHPSPYLVALKHLDLPARQVRAIEDSHAGWTSARGAGLHCLVVGPREFPNEPGREAPERVPDLRETDHIVRLLVIG